MKIKITLLLSISLISCSHKIKFIDQNFYNELNGEEKAVYFIKCLNEKKDSLCVSLYYPEFAQLDYAEYLFEPNEWHRIDLLSESLSDYFENSLEKGDQNGLLAFTIYLYKRGYSTKKLLDDLLKENLRMDTTNILVSYELAKLRCDEGYLGLGHFLLDKMDQLHPGNQEIIRLRKKIERKFGKNTYNQQMDFKKYLSLNPHYIED